MKVSKVVNSMISEDYHAHAHAPWFKQEIELT